MELLFESPSWVLSLLFVMIPCMAICTILLYIVRKSVSRETLMKNHDVAGFTFSIVGVLYSVILGFIVINVQSRYTKAEEIVYEEAAILADLYRESDVFSPSERDKIRKTLREYIHFIIQEEWGGSKGKIIHMTSQHSTGKIWNVYYDLKIEDEKDKIWYTQSIDHLDDLMNARFYRVFNSWGHLGKMIWALLIVGGLITVGFMFFFGLENVHTHLLMMALLSGYLSFMLYLVYSLDHVYQGPEGIKPVALQEVLSIFDRTDAETKAESATQE